MEGGREATSRPHGTPPGRPPAGREGGHKFLKFRIIGGREATRHGTRGEDKFTRKLVFSRCPVSRGVYMHCCVPAAACTGRCYARWQLYPGVRAGCPGRVSGPGVRAGCPGRVSLCTGIRHTAAGCAGRLDRRRVATRGRLDRRPCTAPSSRSARRDLQAGVQDEIFKQECKTRRDQNS
jgi:hypothetical protein